MSAAEFRQLSRRGALQAAGAATAVVLGTAWSSRGLASAAVSSAGGGPESAAADAAAAGSQPVAREDWLSFRGTPDQRGLAGCTLSQDPQPKWELVSKDGWLSSVAIAGAHVYAPALEGLLYCLDLATGREVWKYRTIDDPDPKTFAPGFKAAPLVTADAVYVGDEDGVLHAVDRRTGQRLWKFVTDAEIAGCVAQFGDRLLLASHDSYLYCLSTAGKELWKFQTNDRVNCSPAVVEHFTFLAGCDEHLRVIDVQSGEQVRDVPLGSFLIASPAIVGDVLYVGTHTSEVLAVQWKTGDIVWRYKGERDMPYHASAAVTDDLVLVGSHDKHLHAVDRSTGQGRWTFPTRARIESSAVVVDRRVFFGSGDGNIYGVNLDTGREVWKFNSGKSVNAGLAIGRQCLIVGEDSQKGRLRCFA